MKPELFGAFQKATPEHFGVVTESLGLGSVSPHIEKMNSPGPIACQPVENHNVLYAAVFILRQGMKRYELANDER